MGIFITILIVVLIAALKMNKKEQVQLNITDADVMHPAEFEMREHFFIRCSD